MLIGVLSESESTSCSVEYAYVLLEYTDAKWQYRPLAPAHCSGKKFVVDVDIMRKMLIAAASMRKRKLYVERNSTADCNFIVTTVQFC